MSSKGKILVVGTTPDYIELIRGFSNGNALFITEPGLRAKAFEPSPADWEELLCEFKDNNLLFPALDAHLKKYSLSVSGIVSFDCESLEPASFLAKKLGLPFCSPAGISNSRDKFISKKLWKAAGLKTPETEIVNSVDEALRFFREIRGGCVLKPRTGTGSELVFVCRDEKETENAYNMIEKGLEDRKEARLYNVKASGQIIAEEFIDATEYSADFLINGKRLEIIRISRKIKRKGPCSGITGAYLLLNEAPPDTSVEILELTFQKSCMALEIDRAVCMMDFFAKDGEICLLETAPRPGGDCLPFLIEKAAGLNILKMTMDFSLNPEIPIGNFLEMEPHLGIRIFADNSGIFEKIDFSKLAERKEIKHIEIYIKNGYEVLMPPADYGSWVLGNIIAERKKEISPEEQAREIMENVYCKITPKLQNG